MAKTIIIGRAAAAGLLALGLQLPAAAEPGAAGVEAPLAAAEADLIAEAQLLMALVDRRSMVAGAGADNAEALAFLDRQIAMVRDRVEIARRRLKR